MQSRSESAPKSPSKPASKSPKRLGSSIRKDAIHPADYNRYKLPWACEDCSHFKSAGESCTLGFPTAPHLRRNQILSYNLSGKVALCRLQEID